MKKSHIIAIHNDNKISYHLVETEQEELSLIGKVLGRFESQHYLKNERAIQEEMTRISKKPTTEQMVEGWLDEEEGK